MEIPQEVVENISRTLNDVPEGDSMPYTEVLSVQPLAVRNPDIAQANQASNLPTTPAAPTSTSGGGYLSTQGGMDEAVRKVWVPLRNAKHPARAKKRGKETDSRGREAQGISPRKKHVAYKPKRVEHVTISEDLPSASSHPPLVLVDNVGPPSPASVQEIPIFSSSSLLEDGADSGPKARVEYSSSLLNLPYTLHGGLLVTEDSTLWKKDSGPKARVEYSSRTVILEQVKKDFDEAQDPMEALNPSYSLAHRSGVQDNAHAMAREEERAL
ncbi:hypothetical protein LIER_12852 [Lithospermum erythrorhizon]|uniref:Uncharacterized protein n=1 Tax=Lithospermum erythrorhizon TaxID=34254 RepID=A0AAV3PXT5_LITER